MIEKDIKCNRGRKEGAALDLGLKKIMYANPRAALLVRDTMRLIGEIQSSPGKPCKKLALTFFLREKGVNLGVEVFGGRFMVSFFCYDRPINTETNAQSSPEPGQTESKSLE